MTSRLGNDIKIIDNQESMLIINLIIDYKLETAGYRKLGTEVTIDNGQLGQQVGYQQLEEDADY